MTRKDTVWTSAEVAASYLEGMRGAIPLAGAQLAIMLRVIAAARPNGVTRFMDLGCGDGVLGAALLEVYPKAEAVLVDFSQPMLNIAKEKLGDRATYVFGDYATPDWLDAVEGPFDVIVSGYSIHHQPDARKREVYAEIFDLLAPGGVFLNMEHVAPRASWGEAAFDDLFLDAMVTSLAMTREQAADRHHNRQDKHANILATVEDQCDWLREIGYAEVDCWFKVFELALFGGVRS